MSPMRAAPLLREKKGERRVSGERISSRAAFVFFFGVAGAAAGSLDNTKEGAPARSPVQSCFSFAPSLRRHRGHSPQGWRGRIRYSLFEPASSNLSPNHSQSPPHTHIDCSTLVFLSSSSQPLSLNLNLSPSLPTPSLSPLLFPPQRKKQSASSSAMGGADDDGAKKPTKAKLGVKNEFYFDEELKCWRERGAPPPEGAGPLAPPPTSVPGMSSSAANDGGGGPPQPSSMMTVGSTAAGSSTSE